MRNKKAKMIRKALKLELPLAPDYRVGKKVTKLLYKMEVDADGKEQVTTVPVERITLVNAAKHQYRNVKKVFNGRK